MKEIVGVAVHQSEVDEHPCGVGDGEHGRAGELAHPVRHQVNSRAGGDVGRVGDFVIVGGGVGAVAVAELEALGMIPVIGLISCLLMPAILVLCVMGIIKAMGGQRWRIPLVADLADKF